PANVIGFEREVGDPGEIHDLREAGVEIGILPELFLVGERFGQSNPTQPRSDHQPALLIYLIGGGHRPSDIAAENGRIAEYSFLALDAFPWPLRIPSTSAER